MHAFSRTCNRQQIDFNNAFFTQNPELDYKAATRKVPNEMIVDGWFDSG